MAPMDTTLLLHAAAGLFAIMNPFLALPIFLAMTQGMDAGRQRRTAVRMVAYSLVMSLVVLATGAGVLRVFAIGVDDFRIAGGIVLLIIGLGMLNGHTPAHEGTHAEQRQQAEAVAAQQDPSFYPLAFPMTVGPGTITTLVLLTGNAPGVAGHLTIGLVLIGICALLLAVLWNASAIGHHLSLTVRTIMTRLMGMVLAAISVEMLVVGLRHSFPGLSG